MLHVSILNHQPIEIIRKLRDAGAILSESPENEVILAVDDAAYLEQILALGPYVDHVNGFGKSALCYAAQMGYVDSAKVLLAHGADVNRLTYELTKGQDRKSPIFWGDCCIVSYVRSPLIYACEQGNLDMVRLLLDHGADPSLAHIKWSASRSPEHTGLEWDRLLAKNSIMTPTEKGIARHLLAGE
jgi:ankyrin repeat protein